MARLQIHNKFGQVDISVIDPAAVAEMGDEAQQALSVLIEKVTAREAATVRYSSAVRAMNDAMTEQHEAVAANKIANPPLTPEQALAASVASYNASH